MSQRYCTNCGRPLEDGVSFCTNCGATIEPAADSATTPSAATPTTSKPTTPEPAKANKPSKAKTGRPASSKTRTAPPKPKTSKLSSTYIIGGIAIAAALLAIVYFAFLRPTSNTNATADIPYPDVARTELDDAYAGFEAGTTLFLDVRDRDSYTTMHIPGAVLIQLTDLEARMDELPPGAEILTYCT